MLVGETKGAMDTCLKGSGLNHLLFCTPEPSTPQGCILIPRRKKPDNGHMPAPDPHPQQEAQRETRI